MIRPLGSQDSASALEMVRAWGAYFVLSRGRKIYAAELPGFCAVAPAGERQGLATYELVGAECQLVTLHAIRRYSGIGTSPPAAVRDAAAGAGCRRLWLITTNDNLDAIRFYQRRGFVLTAVYPDAIAESRKLKPQIPRIGNYGIPIRDELLFTLLQS